MAGLTVSVEPTQEPVTLQEVKEYLRVDDSTDERIIRHLLKQLEGSVKNILVEP